MINIKLQGLDEALELLSEKNLTNAIARTIKRAASSGKTIISSQVRDRFNIMKSDLDPKISVDLTGLYSQPQQAALTVTGAPINLSYFRPVQVKENVKTYVTKNRGVAQHLMKSRGTGAVKVKIVKGKTAQLTRSWIMIGKGGIPLVARRYGPGKTQYMIRRVIGYASIVKEEENMQAIQDRITEQLQKEWANNMKYYGSKEG